MHQQGPEQAGAMSQRGEGGSRSHERAIQARCTDQQNGEQNGRPSAGHHRDLETASFKVTLKPNQTDQIRLQSSQEKGKPLRKTSTETVEIEELRWSAYHISKVVGVFGMVHRFEARLPLFLLEGAGAPRLGQWLGLQRFEVGIQHARPSQQ
eukprot:9085761-Pyramimonas_sp.AAC.1